MNDQKKLMIDNKEYFVVYKNLLQGCYYFDTRENWRQHYKGRCEFVTIVDSAQEAQEICTKLEKQMGRSAT